MTLIVEDGTGIYEANAYAGRGFVRNYLLKRNRATAWDAASDAIKDAAIIAATDYIDRRFGPRFLGEKQFTDLTVFASSILQLRVLPVDGNTITIGTVTYTFRAAAAIANEVTIGATLADATGALVAAMAGTGGGVGTVAHPSASGAVLAGVGDVIVRALVAGVLATAIPVSASNPQHVWDYTELTGGADEADQVLEFPRAYLYSPTGLLIEGIPEVLKQAVAEYAERALSGALMPDPEVEATGGQLVRAFDKVGPIETEREFIGGSTIQIFQKYPAADRLLSSLISSSGGVIR